MKTQFRRWIRNTSSVLSVLTGIAVTCYSSFAQTNHTIAIRMLDSKTGKPITTSEFQVWIDHASGTNRTFVRPDGDGIGEITLSPNASVISVHAQYDKAAWSYVNCDSVKDQRHDSDHWYTASVILSAGIVAPNHCSKQKAAAKPGEFVFFVRPMSFWEKMKE